MERSSADNDLSKNTALLVQNATMYSDTVHVGGTTEHADAVDDTTVNVEDTTVNVLSTDREKVLKETRIQKKC